MARLSRCGWKKSCCCSSMRWATAGSSFSRSCWPWTSMSDTPSCTRKLRCGKRRARTIAMCPLPPPTSTTVPLRVSHGNRSASVLGFRSTVLCHQLSLSSDAIRRGKKEGHVVYVPPATPAMALANLAAFLGFFS